MSKVQQNCDSNQFNMLPNLVISIITNEMTLKVLQNLPVNKAPGVDGLVPKVLAEVATSISSPLCTIFNRSMSEGTEPQDWKRANVVPIFKKGAKTEACNYRPVSLTSHICKALESILKDHIMEHLNR